MIKNSVGAKIVGDRVSLQQKGDITVNGAGHGVEVSGSKTTINNQEQTDRKRSRLNRYRYHRR
ncbi:hypothetical protein HT118_05815 [Escherichia coli]|nr:hypothetical protein [Escherichia coli]